MKINTTLVNGEPRVKMNHPLKIFKMAHLHYPIIQRFFFLALRWCHPLAVSKWERSKGKGL